LKELFFIVGLGNPGKEYENTRHNIGFEVVDFISNQLNINLLKLKFKALIGDLEIEGKKIVLVKPQTFMNLSGESIKLLAEWYKISLKNIIIIYDDIDLEIGKIKIKPKGSSGTHNGMKSIIYNLECDEFPRIRIGIGKPLKKWDLAHYVLAKFHETEKNIINESVITASDAAIEIIKSGIDSAMNKYN